MRTPRPLPTPLRRGAFSRRRAAEYGVSPTRLRAQDIIRLGRGLYIWSGATASEMSRLRALQDGYADSWFSHTTAARLFGLHLPRRWQDDPETHISRPLISTTGTKVEGLRTHAVVVEDGEVVTHRGLRVSRPARVFFDLMDRLTEHELVALGDQLVRHPYLGLDDRSVPWETPASLAALVEAHRKTRGIVAGRRAARRVRIGADSWPESMLRLAVVDAGLPEPSLQVRPSPHSIYSGDLGFEAEKVVLQYEGEGHFTAAQQASDQRRNHAFVQEGWLVILVNIHDLREGFISVVDRLSHALERRRP